MTKRKGVLDYDSSDLNGEIWRDIGGYERIYKVSNLGRIKALEKNRNGRWGSLRVICERILVCNVGDAGYKTIFLCGGEKRIRRSVHRLVAETFIPNPENKPAVNHINGIKTDNRVDNLEWATYSENNKHAYDIGLNNPINGELHKDAKITDDQAREIRYNCKELSLREISNIYGIAQSTACWIRNGKSWKHI